MNLCPIVAILAAGQKFCLAYILVSNCYKAVRKAVLLETFRKMVGSCCWLVQLWLFTYFPALKAISFCLDLIDSYHSIVITTDTFMKSVEEVVDYFGP